VRNSPFTYLSQDRGSSAVEFALVFPVMALLVFGIFHLCFLVYANANLHWAVEQAARCAAISQRNTGLSCQHPSNTQSYALSVYKGPNIGLSVSSFTATTATNCRQVSGSGTYPIRTGFVNLNVPLSATACFPADTTTPWT
jgi:Flp pilus assembly protein TadG